MEVFLCRLPIQEEGQEQGRVVSVDGVREHPSSERSGGWVHPHHADKIQQGVAQAVVLSEE
jgi:hypothetical protein